MQSGRGFQLSLIRVLSYLRVCCLGVAIVGGKSTLPGQKTEGLFVVSDNLKAWYRKHHLRIRVLGFSKSEAVFHRPEIERIAADLRGWLRQAAKHVSAILVVIIALTVTHLLWIGRPIMTAYFIAYACGLAGTLVAAMVSPSTPRASPRPNAGIVDLLP
jgi:hypothetical protein